jgi:hypothetical protein
MASAAKAFQRSAVGVDIDNNGQAPGNGPIDPIENRSLKGEG